MEFLHSACVARVSKSFADVPFMDRRYMAACIASLFFGYLHYRKFFNVLCARETTV
jgi:hypothetical protein